MFRVRPAFLSGRTDLAQPGDRSHELSSLPDLRTLRSLPDRISGSVARGAVHLRTDNTMPGEFVLLLLSRFSARCRNCSPPGAFIGNRALRIGRSLRSDAESARNTGSCPASRAAGLHPSRRLVDRRRRHPIPLGRIRQSYISLCGEHTRPGVAISPSRGLRLTDRVSDRFRPRGLCRRKEARARKPVRQGI